MQRLHVHVSVNDLEKSIAFYATLFATGPTIRHPDYAKWMLDDPRVNFAISQRGAAPGVDHLGIQVDSDEALGEVAARLASAGADVAEQKDAACCYARSNKAWVKDPNGVSWETFHTSGQIARYGEDTASAARVAPMAKSAASACCGSGCG